jgi:DNA-binding response OmpR family regulator
MELLLLSAARQPSAAVLPGLDLLPHSVTVLAFDAAAVRQRSTGDLMLLDARRDLAAARLFTHVLDSMALALPVIAIVTEGGLVALSGGWAIDDVVLDTVGPAELETRMRVALERRGAAAIAPTELVQVGDLIIDAATYTARLRGRTLDLTYIEFELLRFLAQHPGRVFSRSQLVQDVWGYDYFGGTRTVDVHVRRLRAKLGPEREQMIGTVRNVGYKFVRPNNQTRTELADVRRICADDLDDDWEDDDLRSR